MKSKSFAVLIDEAHSSTGGTLMRSVNSVLSNMEPKTELDEEDMILDEIRKSGKQDNVSMIAFTATPKPETLQQFGTTNSNGGKEAFDLYSMKQAIDEGYILNVLDNYVTWKTYCHINKIDEDVMKAPAFRMVLTGTGTYAYQRKDGIFIVPTGCLRD